MTSSSKLGITSVGAAAIAVAGLLVAPAPAAFAHGFVGGTASSLVSRAAWTANADRGAVQFEPQSLEGPKGFPAGGPADGQLASAGGLFGGDLDEQTDARWAKNVVQPGPVQVAWSLTAPHRTAEWRYYITKQGWDPNDELERSDLELLTSFAGGGDIPTVPTVHTLNIPSDHTGYHVIYAVWDIADTQNAFYNTIDIDIRGGGAVDPVNPVDPVDPLDPVDPVDPVDPLDPVDPVDPVDPIDPVDPVDPVEDIAPWSATASYSRGDLVQHRGVVYEAVQAHRGWGDETWITALSLWMPTTTTVNDHDHDHDH
jgi:chitin-binding protein